MLDTGFWINQKKKNSLLHPASSDQNPVSASFLRQNLIQKLDTNFEILAYTLNIINIQRGLGGQGLT
jgi:hypothetical protein